MGVTCRKTRQLRAVPHVEILEAGQMPEAFGEQKNENKMIPNDVTHSQGAMSHTSNSPC